MSSKMYSPMGRVGAGTSSPLTPPLPSAAVPMVGVFSDVMVDDISDISETDGVTIRMRSLEELVAFASQLRSMGVPFAGVFKVEFDKDGDCAGDDAAWMGFELGDSSYIAYYYINRGGGE